MDGWMDQSNYLWINGSMDWWIDQLMYWPMDQLINLCIDRWIDRWSDGWMDGWIDGWIDVSMDRWIDWWINQWIYSGIKYDQETIYHQRAWREQSYEGFRVDPRNSIFARSPARHDCPLPALLHLLWPLRLPLTSTTAIPSSLERILSTRLVSASNPYHLSHWYPRLLSNGRVCPRGRAAPT